MFNSHWTQPKMQYTSRWDRPHCVCVGFVFKILQCITYLKLMLETQIIARLTVNRNHLLIKSQNCLLQLHFVCKLVLHTLWLVVVTDSLEMELLAKFELLPSLGLFADLHVSWIYVRIYILSVQIHFSRFLSFFPL